MKKASPRRGDACAIHGEPLVDSHPADPETGPQPSDLENELICLGCDYDLAHAPSECVAHRRDADACLECRARELAEAPASDEGSGR